MAGLKNQDNEVSGVGKVCSELILYQKTVSVVSFFPQVGFTGGRLWLISIPKFQKPTLSANNVI
jgi:hypothetical protein